MTPGGALDEGISSELGKPPQLGKSILLLPTAASSDSFWSKIQFRDVGGGKKKKKKRKKVNCCFAALNRKEHREIHTKWFV